jgi:hypothetical protein
MKELEESILQWHREIFPHATVKAVREKLWEEFREADVEVFYRIDRKAGAMELADIFISGTAWCNKHGISLVDCIVEKLDILRASDWGEEKADGSRDRVK